MIVVTGATGNVGTPLVEALSAAGEAVTAVARRFPAEPHAEPPTERPGEVRRIRADLTDPATLIPALAGSKALFLLTGPDLLAAESGVDGVLAEVERQGVRKVVLLSSLGVATHRHPPLFEDAVRATGMDWTFLRPGNFASNARQWAPRVREHREIAAPFADIGLPAVDPADIAEVAAVVLREDGHHGRAYELTGPAAITPRQQAAAIEAALGAPIRFVERSREEALAELRGFMPERVALTTMDILGTPSEAERRIGPDVRSILGRPARPFADWVARNVGAFSR